MDNTEKYQVIRDSHPILRFCERFNETSDIWDFNVHSHPYIELMFFLEGTASIDLAGTSLSVSLFDTVIYPAGCPHREDPSPELKREIICLWVELPELELEAPLQIQDSENQLNNLFFRIHEESKRERKTPFLLEYYLKALLTLVLRLASEERQKQMLPNVMQYIHTHFTEQIALDTLAKLEHISKSYLSRQFKRFTGMTVIEYVNSLRVEMAKHLLVTSDESVTNIAYHVGYESPKYFYRTFRAACGLSPAAFRKAQAGRLSRRTASGSQTTP